MVVARFHFLPHRAGEFCEQGQEISELVFDDIVELVRFTKEIEDCLYDVLVFDGTNIISLRQMSV